VKLDAGDTPIGDKQALRFVERIDVAPLVDVAKVVTNLGAFPVTVGSSSARGRCCSCGASSSSRSCSASA
jgi:hypothetical protein